VFAALCLSSKLRNKRRMLDTTLNELALDRQRLEERARSRL
jgi:uncharacterized membrane protein YqjE